VSLPDRQALVARLCPPLDPTLAGQFVEQFVEMEKRYIQRDWGPSGVDGGMFAEALARILYHQDSGTLNLRKPIGECLDYIEDAKGPVQHALGIPATTTVRRSDVVYIARLLRLIWKFRSDRGIAHLSATYNANHMDSRLVAEMVRWCMTESLRIFGAGDREAVARMVRELLRFEVPCIARYGDTLLIQRTDLTAEEEVLVLLHHGGEEGVPRRDISRTLRFFSSSTVSGAVTKLEGLRQIAMLPGERWCLTDLGAKRVREELAGKLLAL
jgi:hypothetical protein